MATLFEGTFQQGKAVNVEVGKSGKKVVRWEMIVVDDGPHKSKSARYSGKLDPDNIKWTKRDMIMLGWQPREGKYLIETFVEDVAKANKLVPFTAEIATFERDDGSVSRWTSARLGGAKPLAPLDSDEVRDVNGWFAEVSDGEEIPF